MSEATRNRRWFIETTSLGLLALGACGTEKNPPTLPTDPTTPSENPSNPQQPTQPAPEQTPQEPQSPQEPTPPEICEETTQDIKGPFYRENPPSRIAIAAGEAGTVLTIRGVVYGEDCETPLSNTGVDVWQAGDNGEYDNSSAAYRLRGQMTTNAQGEYEFKTILPGRYLNGSTYRPRHIHYQVSHPISEDQTTTLITQLYFEGDEFLASDPWAEESRTIPLEDVNGELNGTFDIVLAVPV